MPKKPIVIQVSNHIKRNTVVVLAEGDYREYESRYAHETGQTGRDLKFKFVSVSHDQYCNALAQIQTIVQSGVCLTVYVVDDFDRTKNTRFIAKLRRNLNRRNAAFLSVLEKNPINLYVIDRKAGTTRDLLPGDSSDRKKPHYLNAG